jgi:serine/threonine protein kinase
LILPARQNLTGQESTKAGAVPFSWSDALEIYGLPLASALASAHLKGVEHRDIKPGNILVRANGDPVLADFGIGKLRGPDPTSLTVANYRSGVYAPPEFSAPSRTCRSSSAWDSSCSVGCCCSWPGA